MIIPAGPNFRSVYHNLTRRMLKAPVVDQHRWQGRTVKDNPAARCYELRNVVFEIDLESMVDLDYWRKDIDPNLPFADLHFEERISGIPSNPGEAWKQWPWNQGAETFLEEGERFNHTYQERFWPRFARSKRPREGIDREYGDVEDLVELLRRDPYTRQAYLPIFFPEDTGWGDGGRKPCTLGYHFLFRGNHLNIHYPIRACDLYRHFRDDCYMAVRLLMWVVDELRDTNWGRELELGTYSMWIGSLHMFEADRKEMMTCLEA